ncbi:MAG: transcriptional regulator [Henriciella sp.]|uniref:metalloregulator ArsR/SmtB family transcription factor n=1 Tax=Henriciella sp. TaxID=1968823 RepID=UPI000C10B317|nr:metalloregulator ArsR/SmtB family transcription factor [Henriciella sp.]MAN73412.1 transcriptional regulator [Henriciella sp.]MBF33579.1 transcriptional regulator [Hyphomonadaceae bacterium]MBK76314.1 transcriptional regulator [Henriciella sp.]PHR71835.1 MAG: transcriptional regulator [Henriciella sp.]|tara:strand:- start:125 stop:430 length:306 start_codon:yes stop_codon:yes gene_type:complete
MTNNVFSALGHPLRRQVMDLLRKGPRTSGELADAFEASWPTVSRHLSVLKDADLITAERQGTSIIYRANTSVIEDAAAALLAMIGRDNGDDDDDDMKEAAE